MLRRCAPVFRSFLIVAVLLVVCAACSKKPAAPTSAPSGATATAPAQKVEPTGERILNFHNLYEPEYLDPGMMSGHYEHNIGASLFEGLLELDPKDSAKTVPGVAERYDVSPDGTVYTFHLRKDAQWSDGKPVTAYDFVYSWERVLNPKTASSYAFILYYIKNGKAFNTGVLTDPAQLGLKAVDDATFQVTLEHPTTYFPSLTAFHSYRPVPKAVVEQFGSEWTKPEHMVSNGAFMLKTWVPNKEILTIKNPRYWDAANVKLAGVRFLPIEDRETAFKMYEAGQLDVAWELPPVKVPSLLGRPDMVAAPHLATYYYRVNVTKPPFDNPKVRQAFALGIDRKTLCEQYLKNIEIPSSSFTPAGLGNYVPPQGWDFNPAAAKQLLTEAGYADPSTFPAVTLLYNTDEKHKLIAQVVQQMWKEHLGISVTLQNEEWKSYLKTMEQLNYQVVRSAWVGDYSDPSTFLELYTSTSGQNQTGWKNAEFDNLVMQVSKTADPNQRNVLMQQAESLLLKEAPVLPVYTYKKHMLVRPYVKGFYPTVQDLHPMKFVSLEGPTATAQQ
ncbi:MAG: peptide ABC transporter substrate-binding protein [Deltaproteobacteria bacterium]|nr:peptide ABC transporter substrate-binding protein [Deltaproteobacteria bacterium]